MLEDRRIEVVESKGAYLYDSEEVKRQIGGAWVDARNGRACSVCPPTEDST